VQFAQIVLLDFADGDLEPEDWSSLSALAVEVHRCRSTDPGLHARLSEVDCLLVQLGVAVTSALLDAAPRLRYVGVFGTSMGRIDVEASRRGIAIRNVPGFSTEAVAELAIGMMLDHLRDLSGARARARRGDLAEPLRLGQELRGRRVGIVGLGAIGRRVAEIARVGFGADVRYWSRTPRPETELEYVALDALLESSDIVSVHAALAPETRSLLHADRIARIQRGALLVHLSPPELVDLSALTARLRAGSLHFSTDHGDEMDPADLETLRAIDACTLYPPIGYATHEAKTARRERFLAELALFLRA